MNLKQSSAMAEAAILSSKPKPRDINKYRELDNEWYSLGVELDIEDDELDDLEKKYSDLHMRFLKMFGVWLEKGENPTYWKLLKALVNSNKRDVAQSICTDKGLTSSLDSLLKTAMLSKSNPIPSGQREETLSDPITSEEQPMAIAPVDISAYEIMIRCHKKLVTALSTDLLSISGILLERKFISESVYNRMCLRTITEEERAIDLVMSITRKIHLVPGRFQELLYIFSEQTCTEDIVQSLSFHISHEKDRKEDIDSRAIISTNQQYAMWASLDPDDKIDLEARLVTDAEIMGRDFALLCCRARESFEQRGITPQVLAYVLLDLMVYRPTSNSATTCIPFLKEEEEILINAQSVHDTFNALRPHMSFYNYEILEFLIQGKGSEADKAALAEYLRKFTEFCKRHVFEVPQLLKYSNGHQSEGHKMKQKLHVKVTDHFKAAFLLKSTVEALPSTGDEPQAKNICSSKLGINLEDAKNIQRKLAKILNLNTSALFLDTISEGSIILTFLLPSCVSLAGLDDNPEIVQLSSNGISILCGPPGRLKLIDVTENGMIMRWSQPEYGCKSLTRYTVYYRKKEEHETSEWQTFELGSLNTHTCVPHLSDGDTYVFKICTVSNGKTLQYSGESDPIIISADGILTENIHKVVIANKDMLTSAFLSADPNMLAANLLGKGIISKEDETQISLASTPSEKATILVAAVEYQIKSSPEKFQDFLNTLSKAKLSLLISSAFSLADPNIIAAVLSIKGIISKEDEMQISQASTPIDKVSLLVTAAIKGSLQDFLNAIQKADISLPEDIVEALWSAYKNEILTSALSSRFSSSKLNKAALQLEEQKVILEQDQKEISQLTTRNGKAKTLLTAVERRIKHLPKKLEDFLNAIQKASLSLPDDIVETLKVWSDYHDKDSSPHLNTIIAVLSIRGVISKEDETQINLAFTARKKATLLVTAIKNSPEKFRDVLNAIQKANLSLPEDIVNMLWSSYNKNVVLTSALSSADPNALAAKLAVKKVISIEEETQISLASTPNEKATILVAALEHPIKRSSKKFKDFLNILQTANLSLSGDVVETLWSDYYNSVYKQYLDYLYASLDNKQRSSDQWPPSVTKKFFRLAMIRSATVRKGYIESSFIEMTITGKVDDILCEKYPILLEDIFKETEHQRKLAKENIDQRMVILLEGAPGCGKSTLSVHICQQWEKSQLFGQFKLVIFVRLRDPEVKNAKGLADLLPCSNLKTAQLLAGIMMEMKCQDVLFILDGWDELPIHLRKKSIFGDLISPYLPSSNPFSGSSIIITSRPISSGDLHQVVSSRIEILGFTAEELHQFFTECLKGDIEAVQTLLERIEENPEVAGSCYLPLNATILVHLFKNDQNRLPTTLYGIFSSLILSCIKRHLKLRTPQYKDASIDSLDRLPEFAKKPFSFLCQIAYNGVMEDKVIFTSLPADVNTLSILQGVESFIGREKTVSHNFIHLSIQELLAAWYIAMWLPASEQVSKFNELFDKSRFSAIFQFYAAITKLRTPGIEHVVIKITRAGNEYLLVSLLHCLHEAQDPFLCQSVAQQLQRGLDLRDTTLTPSDCLCIGYFLAHVCKMTADEFKVNYKVTLDSCSIGDQACKYLVSGLHKYLDTHSEVSTPLRMNMDRNTISHHSIPHLSKLLNIGCISVLNLADNDFVSKLDTFSLLAQQLKYNTTLKQLWLKGCGLNSQSAVSLAEALTTNKHLKQLSISDNALYDDGIQRLACALRVNQGLKVLSLHSCGMTDVGLEYLAKSLQQNKFLIELDVYNVYRAKTPNRLTEKIIPVLTECLRNNCTLTKLELPRNLQSSKMSIEEAINNVREKSRFPLIEIKV